MIRLSLSLIVTIMISNLKTKLNLAKLSPNKNIKWDTLAKTERAGSAHSRHSLCHFLWLASTYPEVAALPPLWCFLAWAPRTWNKLQMLAARPGKKISNFQTVDCRMEMFKLKLSNCKIPNSSKTTRDPAPSQMPKVACPAWTTQWFDRCHAQRQGSHTAERQHALMPESPKDPWLGWHGRIWKNQSMSLSSSQWTVDL